MKLLLLSIILVSCGQANGKKRLSEYKLRCEEVKSGVKRCENQEVVCYQLWNDALQCIPKVSI